MHGICFRLAYSVRMVENVVKSNKEGVQTTVMYDIACSLQKHLQVRKYRAVATLFYFNMFIVK